MLLHSQLHSPPVTGAGFGDSTTRPSSMKREEINFPSPHFTKHSLLKLKCACELTGDLLKMQILTQKASRAPNDISNVLLGEADAAGHLTRRRKSVSHTQLFRQVTPRVQ